MPVKRLKEFLDSQSVRYVSIQHSTTYTAQEVAQSAHISGKDMAKTVMVFVDGKMAMAVLPAIYKLDLGLLAGAAGGAVELAAEPQFRGRFPDCELGAMPPFGNLYGMDVYVDESLSRDEEIAFNAGTHSELIVLRYDDFARLVKPKVARIADVD